jgi:hypothetical protein
VLFETGAASKPAVAKVAFPRFAIPRQLVDRVRDFRVTLPANEFLGDESVRVLGAHEAKYLVAVQMGRIGTGSALEVVGQSSGGGTSRVAEGAFNLDAAVGT